MFWILYTRINRGLIGFLSQFFRGCQPQGVIPLCFFMPNRKDFCPLLRSMISCCAPTGFTIEASTAAGLKRKKGDVRQDTNKRKRRY